VFRGIALTAISAATFSALAIALSLTLFTSGRG